MANPLLDFATGSTLTTSTTFELPEVDSAEDDVLAVAFVQKRPDDSISASGWTSRATIVSTDLGLGEKRWAILQKAIPTASGPYHDTFSTSPKAGWGGAQALLKSTGSQPTNKGTNLADYHVSGSGDPGADEPTLTVTFDDTPTAGNLLMVWICPSGATGGFSGTEGYILEDGFEELERIPFGANVSEGCIAVKVADGTESGPLTFGTTRHNVGALTLLAVEFAAAPDVEPPPDPVQPFVCALNDTDLSELVCIETGELAGWAIRDELQGVGSGYVEIHRSHPAANESFIKKGNWFAVTIPQIDADPIFVFQMERIQTTLISRDEGGGEIVKIAGRGSLSYFERAAAHPRSYVNPAGLDADGILHGPASTGNKAGQILKRAMDEWQHVDRGVTDFGLRLEPIQHVTHDFDYDDDSSGAAWNVTGMTAEMSMGYVGEHGLVGLMELIGTGEIDIVLWPTFLLQAFNSYGRDLTGDFAADTVRFERGVNIAEELVRDEGLAVEPTHMIVRGQDESGATTYAFAESPVFGAQAHVEGFLATFGSDTAALEAAGVADMARRIRQGESVQFRVKTPRFGQDPDPANGLYLPGPEGTNGQYWKGDTVTLHTGTGFRDYDEVEPRVMAIVITGDDAGDLEATVELKATTLTGRLIPGTGTAAGFGGSVFTSGGAVGTPGTGGGSIPPPPAGAAVSGHVNDPTGAHDASAVSFDATGLTNTDADDVQEAIEDLDAAIEAVVVTGDHDDLTGRDSPGNHSTYALNVGGEGHVTAVIPDAGATETLDLSAANAFKIGLSTGCTLTLTPPTDDGTERRWALTFSGAFAVTWPASVIWIDGGGTAPEAAETLRVGLVTLDGGTTYLASAGRGSGSGSPGASSNIFTVDPGAPSYDDTDPSEVVVTIVSKFGIDGSGDPYFNDAGVTSGEEAALMRDPETGQYLLRSYNF